MTTFSVVANSEIAVGAPITNSLMTKLRDNLHAIIEGDATASSYRIAEAALAAAVVAQLVTNGDSHDHSGGDGSTIPAGGIASAAITRAKLSTSTSSQSGNGTTSAITVSLSPYAFVYDAEADNTAGDPFISGLRAPSPSANADAPQFLFAVEDGRAYSVAWRYVAAS